MSQPTYTMLTVADAEEILGESVAAVDEIKGGWANSNFKVTTKRGALVLLKVSNEKPAEELRTQIAVLEALRPSGFPAAYPHSPPLRDWNGLPVLVFDFVVGTSPDRLATAAQARAMGDALARLHATSVPSGVQLPNFAMGIAEMTPFLAAVDAGQGAEGAVAAHPFVSRLRAMMPHFEALEADESLPVGLAHGDLFADNSIFDADEPDRLLAIVDWEEICLVPHMLDLAMTVLGCCPPGDEAMRSAMMDAYAARRPLTDAEQARGFPIFLAYAAMSIAFWRFRQFNVRHADDAALREHYRPMLDIAEQALAQWTQ